jgi:hypothetical protein
VSEDKNLTASSSPAVAIGFSRRTITILLAAIVGLATAFLILTGGGSGTVAHADPDIVHVNPGSLTDHDCDATEWHFVITQIGTGAPANITVFWSDGTSTLVPLDKVTGGTAHYVTTDNLDLTVVDATADLPAGWSGQFNVSHGPCGPSPSPTPTFTS